ncbi:MAG: hypothetical protein RDU89_07150 [bacterium]|nr:hypothetical protein [bacterium]
MRTQTILRWPALGDELELRPAVGVKIEDGILRYRLGRGQVERCSVQGVMESLASLIRRAKGADQFLADFYSSHAPLFDVNPVRVDWAAEKIWMLYMLSAAYGFTRRRPPNAVFLEHYLNRLKDAAETNTGEKRFGWAIVGDMKDLDLVVDVFYPVSTHVGDALHALLDPRFITSWPVFSRPGQWPSTRDEIVRYWSTQLIINVNWWLAWNIKVKVTQNFAARLEPRNLYTKLLLASVQAVLPTGSCHCGCGLPTYGTKYAAPAHKYRVLGTREKRAVQSYFRQLRNRGKITSEQYEKAKKAIASLFSRGITDRKELREKVWARIKGQ